MEDNDNNGNGDGQKHRGHGDKGNNNKGGLDSTAEHLLIAAGAIGKQSPNVHLMKLALTQEKVLLFCFVSLAG